MDPIVQAIAAALSQLGISVRLGEGTDVTVIERYLAAGWGSGGKSIDYEARFFADSAERTVYAYEKTQEVSQGLQFGSDSESSFQSGTTLFRKVKGSRIGLDGRVVEYEIDLGAIPKAVKAIVQQHGWTYRPVLLRKKAMHPPGYAPAPASAPAPAPASGAPAQAPHWGFCSGCGKPLMAGARFCASCGKPVPPR